jgi:multisubunit Na+/H+ antiporter MnhG subunit
MREGLIALGVIFLVLGVLFYFVPMQQFNVPVEWTYASAAIGFILLIFGLVIPDPVRVRILRDYPRRNSYEKIVETRKDVESDDGNKHKTVIERKEKHVGRRGDID